MRCDNIMKRYLEQTDVYPSALIRIHMMFCPSCREEIRKLRKTFLNARMEPYCRIPRDMTGIIMQKIEGFDTYKDEVPSARWILSGVIMFSGIFIVSYSDSFVWLRDHFGREIEIPINIVFGFLITFYAASYIATHLDNVKKLMDFINHKMH